MAHPWLCCCAVTWAHPRLFPLLWVMDPVLPTRCSVPASPHTCQLELGAVICNPALTVSMGSNLSCELPQSSHNKAGRSSLEVLPSACSGWGISGGCRLWVPLCSMQIPGRNVFPLGHNIQVLGCFSSWQGKERTRSCEVVARMKC